MFCKGILKHTRRALDQTNQRTKKGNDLESTFKPKNLADVIESLTGVIFLKSGFHGSLSFLREIEVLDSSIDFSEKRQLLIDGVYGSLEDRRYRTLKLEELE